MRVQIATALPRGVPGDDARVGAPLRPSGRGLRLLLGRDSGSTHYDLCFKWVIIMIQIALCFVPNNVTNIIMFGTR